MPVTKSALARSLTLVVLTLATVLAFPAAAQADPDLDPVALALAERFAPVIAIQRQAEPCGPGEPYLPTDALALIGHPEVELVDEQGRVVTHGPTADDLAAAPDDWHIDFPGAALRPGCDFERWFRDHGDDHATLYARVATDPDHPNRLALQYWSFWIYNDWNNLHEGDWEMVQLVFDVATAEAALDSEPVEVVVAQHEGAQRAPWAEVERLGPRPVVYPAGGSHATFFEPGLWLGKRPDAGFGCDDSRGPSDRLDPALVLLPETVDPDGPHAWVGWRGRWGERQPLFNNGPEGPVAKTQWTRPISWVEDTARTASLRVPVVGGDVTDLFCSATERGSLVVVRFFANPVGVVGALGMLVAAGVLLVRRTAWTPIVPRPVHRPRRSGQILGAAARLVRTEWRRFVPVAAVVVAGGLGASLIRTLLDRVWLTDDLERLLQGDSTAGAVLSLAVGGLVTVPTSVVALAVGVAIAASLDRPAADAPDRPRSWWTVAAVIAVLAVASGPLWWPLGVYLVARWGAAPAAAAHGASFGDALATSRRLTRGRRLPTAVVLVVAIAVAGLAGPLLGALVLIVTQAHFTVVNLLAGLVSAVLLPWLAVVAVMVHADLDTRHRPTEPPR